MGLHVIALARQEAVEGLAHQEHVTALAVDLLDESDVRRAIQEAAGSVERLNALVCLAGGFFGDTPLADTPPQRLQDQFSLNVMTAYNCVNAMLPHFLEAGGG